ncbi:hypothetical protein SEVIR_1G344051v4 [Setaria viridis]
MALSGCYTIHTPRKLHVTEKPRTHASGRGACRVVVYSSTDLNRAHCGCRCTARAPPRPAPPSSSSRQAGGCSTTTAPPPLHAAVAGRPGRGWTSGRCTWAVLSHTQRSDRSVQ